MKIRSKLRDWWRGYSIQDVRSAQGKLDEAMPGYVGHLSPSEMRAMLKEGLQHRPWPRIVRIPASDWAKCFHPHTFPYEFFATLETPPLTSEEMRCLIEAYPA